ncbi:DUF5753 domain-containing protein [Streptomyces sp. NBC_00400]|uniref:Scr1 family TA system antitoxin-like transcriptional regulator n=1 Tax=Streptomyces sp. NBC_00400 TaxID=2975737 RepID=UPI002E1FD2D9
MSPSSSIQQAREALGKRLREIRKDSGLTARAVAAAGWHESKSSRLENGRTPPSDEDIRIWTRICEEWVLRTVIGDSATMVSQLGHLIGMTAAPSLSLGVIPMGAVRGNAWPCESFSLYDEKQASCELVSAGLTVKQPSEIAEYAKTFTELAGIAVYGAAARKLITSAIDTLG